MSVQFSAKSKKKIEAMCERYPSRQSALLGTLHLAQGEFGCLSEEVMHAVADILELPATHVSGVATFYTMYRREAGGTNTLRVCTNIACMLRGGYEVLAGLEKRLGFKAGENDDDFSLVEEECIAACANAPAVLCGTRYFLDVEVEQLDEMLDDLRKKPRPESEVTLTMPADRDTKVVTARFGNEDAKKIATYEALGGYKAARKAVAHGSRRHSRRDEGIEPARSRRCRISHRDQMGIRPQGCNRSSPCRELRRVRNRAPARTGSWSIGIRICSSKESSLPPTRWAPNTTTSTYAAK